MSLEAEMLAHIKAGVDHHNATCPMPARAILLNSGNYELFGWDEVCGLPFCATGKEYARGWSSSRFRPRQHLAGGRYFHTLMLRTVLPETYPGR